MDLTTVILVAIAVMAIIVFLIFRNKKDETEFENNLNNNYPKPKEHDSNV